MKRRSASANVVHPEAPREERGEPLSPPPLRERIRETTRRAILDAAEAAFGERGFAAARMDDIARRAGVSVGTLYNYFEDRGALLHAVIAASAAELAARLAAHAPARGAPFERALEAFVTTVLAHVDDHLRLYAALVDHEPPGQRPVSETALGAAQRLVAAGVAAGALRRGDAALHAPLLVGMLRGAIVERLRSRGGEPPSGCAGAVVRLFLHGATRRPA